MSTALVSQSSPEPHRENVLRNDPPVPTSAFEKKLAAADETRRAAAVGVAENQRRAKEQEAHDLHLIDWGRSNRVADKIDHTLRLINLDKVEKRLIAEAERSEAPTLFTMHVLLWRERIGSPKRLGWEKFLEMVEATPGFITLKDDVRLAAQEDETAIRGFTLQILPVYRDGNRFLFGVGQSGSGRNSLIASFSTRVIENRARGVVHSTQHYGPLIIPNSQVSMSMPRRAGSIIGRAYRGIPRFDRD